jgi:hypothetical protein
LATTGHREGKVNKPIRRTKGMTMNTKHKLKRLAVALVGMLVAIRFTTQLLDQDADFDKLAEKVEITHKSGY